MLGGALFLPCCQGKLNNSQLRNMVGFFFSYLNLNKVREQIPRILSKVKCVSQHCIKHDIPLSFPVQECSDQF